MITKTHHCAFVLILAFISGSASIDCEWLGHAPICGNHDCPSGWVELARTKSGYGVIADFGENVCVDYIGGKKTLCCKKEAIKKDMKKHCITRYEKKECLNGTVRAYEVGVNDLMGIEFTCCTPGTFA